MDVLIGLWSDKVFLMKATGVFIVMAWLLLLCLTVKTGREKKED